PGASPYGMGVGPDGNLWFTDGPSNQVGRITLQGQVTVYDVPTPNAVLGVPTAGPNNTPRFSEPSPNQIGQISPNAPPTARARGRAITGPASRRCPAGSRGSTVSAPPAAVSWPPISSRSRSGRAWAA